MSKTKIDISVVCLRNSRHIFAFLSRLNNPIDINIGSRVYSMRGCTRNLQFGKARAARGRMCRHMALLRDSGHPPNLTTLYDEDVHLTRYSFFISGK